MKKGSSGLAGPTAAVRAARYVASSAARLVETGTQRDLKNPPLGDKEGAGIEVDVADRQPQRLPDPQAARIEDQQERPDRGGPQRPARRGQAPGGREERAQLRGAEDVRPHLRQPGRGEGPVRDLSLIHISEPTRLGMISY